MDPGLLHPLGGQVRVHPRWEAEVAPHRALGRAERPGPVDGGQHRGVGFGQPDAHRGPEQPGKMLKMMQLRGPLAQVQTALAGIDTEY